MMIGKKFAEYTLSFSKINIKRDRCPMLSDNIGHFDLPSKPSDSHAQSCRLCTYFLSDSQCRTHASGASATAGHVEAASLQEKCEIF